MLENFIDKHLKKQGFIRVPEAWSTDYQELVEKHSASNKLLRELGREYNSLLQEIAEAKGPKYMISGLNEIDIKTDGIKGQALIDLYIKTFAIDFEDDTDEVIK